MRASAQVYFDLRHDNLLNLLSCDDVGGGVALVFPLDGRGMLGENVPGAARAVLCAAA